NERGETALHHAASRGSTTMLEILLDKGVDVNAKDKHGITPIHLAAQNDSSDAVKLLLERGADINAKIIDGKYANCTPLDIAKRKNKKNC
ncbi:MAG: ankyrin repeat domain-containing protein, partial [Desulfovibrio sp.]|nr:ankyrin repeat domain-containing protein [Desulfovibrio sp.]